MASPEPDREDGNLPATEAGPDSGYETEDPGFGDASVLTQSMESYIYAHQEENGRRYHAYKQGIYFMPNDDEEQGRMDVQNRAMWLVSGKEILYAPLAEAPQNVLDLGTGTGTWAIDMADKYSETHVIGVDLSPIQPNWVPPNIKFEVDDVEENWSYPKDHFDVIHSRFMLFGSIADVRKYFRQAYEHCKPGGVFEIHDMSLPIKSDHEPIPEDGRVNEWGRHMRDGIEKMHRRFDLDFDKLRELLHDVGFVDVVVLPLKLPIGTWPKVPHLKQAGFLQHFATLGGLEALTLAVFTRKLGWSATEVQVFLAHVREEFKGFRKKRIYPYWPCAVLYGIKPEHQVIEEEVL